MQRVRRGVQVLLVAALLSLDFREAEAGPVWEDLELPVAVEGQVLVGQWEAVVQACHQVEVGVVYLIWEVLVVPAAEVELALWCRSCVL